jgi:amphi-Trp domain-containing protein
MRVPERSSNLGVICTCPRRLAALPLAGLLARSGGAGIGQTAGTRVVQQAARSCDGGMTEGDRMLQSLLRRSAPLPARYSADPQWARSEPGPRLHLARMSPAAQGSEAEVKLMELKDKTTLSREEAAARLHAIADELASGNDVVIERETMRFVAHVPDQVNLKVEFEVEDDGAELEIELTW